MKFAPKALVIAAGLALTACVAATPEGQSIAVSEAVREAARPGQDLEAVRIQSDGCYWWLYQGPVEATYIPLETRDGRMICTR